MVVYLGGLLVFSSVALGEWERLWRGIFIVLLYAVFDLLWTYVRDKTWYLPVSSMISGLILSLVAIPEPPFRFIILLPFVAVFSKQILRLGKPRHIFNPASFSMAIIAFFVPSVSWWGVAWGRISSDMLASILFVITLAVGIMILWRQNRWHVALPFLLSYAVLLALLFWWNGVVLARLIGVVSPLILDGTVLFFATVMLIEPITSSFPYLRDRVWYGVSVGFFAVLMTYLSGVVSWANIDPLIFGLLLGNLVASLLFLPQRRARAAISAAPRQSASPKSAAIYNPSF